MPIPVLPTTSSRTTLVYSLDTSVTPKDKNQRGWIPENQATCEEDADRVEVRPLNTDERALANDCGGFHGRNLARVRTGLVTVNGDTKRKIKETALRAWGDVCVSLLGMYIRDLTDGRDPNQAKYTDAIFDGEEPDDDDDAEKKDDTADGDDDVED